MDAQLKSLADTKMFPHYPAIMPKKGKQSRDVYFLRNEQPSVRRALPPVGWQRTVVQPWQITTVWAWEKTVVIVKQPGHLTSMKKDRGAGTRALSLCLRASAAGLGLRRSTARTILSDFVDCEDRLRDCENCWSMKSGDGWRQIHGSL